MLLHKFDNPKKFFSNKYIKFVVICIVALLFNLHPPLDSLNIGLDPSFDYGFNKAAAMHLSFGNQFISTYGPLGYLTHDYLPQYLIRASVFQLLYAIALGIGVYLFMLRFYKLRSVLLGYITAALLTYAFSIGSSISIDLNYLSLFLMYCFLLISYEFSAHKRKVFLLILTLVAALFLYIKFTLAFASFCALVMLPISDISFYPLGQRVKSITQSFIEVLSIVFLYFLLAYSFSILLHINNFADYINTSWIMSYGFSGAMSYQQPGTFIATLSCALALLMLTLMFVIPLPRTKTLAHKTLFLAVPIFIIWKYAVVRQDAHIMFLAQLTLPLVLLVLFARIKKNWVNICALLSLFSVVTVLTVISSPLNKLVTNQTIAILLKTPVNNILQKNSVGFFQLSKERATWQQESQILLSSDKLPYSFMKIIGSSGVDIYPWEASIVAANNLNWQPRPSPFSFESYTPTFDSLNARYFTSSNAPKYIVWQNVLGNINGSTSSIDGRNVLWDEPKTIRTILQTYSTVAYADNKLILFKKRALKTIKKVDVIKTQKVLWSQRFNVPSLTGENKYLFLSASYKTDKLIKLEGLLLRTESISLIIYYKNGESSSYRIIPANLSQGFLINPLPDNWLQLIHLFSRKGSVSSVSSIMFVANTNYMAHVSSIHIRWLAL